MLPAVTRPEPPTTGDEADVDGLARLPADDDALEVRADRRRRTGLRGVEPSSLTLLGLVRHMAYVEWHWFDHVFAGNPTPPPISVEADPDADFNDLDPSRAMEDFDLFTSQCDVSRAIVGAADGLDATAAAADGPISLRWIMIHMIEEYAAVITGMPICCVSGSTGPWGSERRRPIGPGERAAGEHLDGASLRPAVAAGRGLGPDQRGVPVPHVVAVAARVRGRRPGRERALGL